MHWKQLTNTQYLGAYSLDGVCDSVVLTIASFKKETIVGNEGKKDEKIVLHFKEKTANGVTVKPMIFNATNCKAVAAGLKTPHLEEWVGKKIEVFIQRGLLLKQTKEVIDCLRVRMPVPVAAPVKQRIPFDSTNEKWPAMIQSVLSGKYTATHLATKYALNEADLDALMEAEDAYKAKMDMWAQIADVGHLIESEATTDTEKAEIQAAKDENE